jgi:hypothetical protein
MQALSGLKLKVWKVVKEQARVSYAAVAISKRVNLHHPNYVTTPRLSLAFQGFHRVSGAHVNIFPRSIGSTDTSRPEQQVYQCVSTTWSATAPITSIATPNSSSHIRRRRPKSPPAPDPKVGSCLLTPAGGSKLSKFSQYTTHAKRFKITSNPTHA